MKQIGALPLILLENGQVEVYLVTSRGGRRWIIPKGNPMRGLSACDVAALEAREEAGVIGTVLDACLGEFTLRGRNKKCRVSVYPLIVEEKLLHWDEVSERKWRRCDLKTARACGQSQPCIVAGFPQHKEGDAPYGRCAACSRTGIIFI